MGYLEIKKLRVLNSQLNKISMLILIFLYDCLLALSPGYSL